MADLLDRLTAKVGFEDSCWPWLAYRNPLGYGMAWDSRRRQMRLAHRVLYEVIVGDLPPGFELDHLCRLRACVNPDHLEPVTHHENVLRGDIRSISGNKTHCPQGHPYDEENTRLIAGRRQCKECGRAATRRWRLRHRPVGVSATSTSGSSP